MNDVARWTAFVAISLFVAANATAQQASAPAQPASASATPSAAGSPPAASIGPNVASVAETNGRAMLNHASVYAVAKQSERLQVGDRLVVLENGLVKVQFDTGCMLTIDSPQVYTVPAAAPCAPGQADRGVRAATPVSGTGAVPAAANEYLKWGLVALGVATPLLLLSNSSSGRPISP